MKNHNAAPYANSEQEPALELARFADRQIASQGIPESFPMDIECGAYEAHPCKRRKDLRWLDCLTIDCDATKDMDDAVSLSPVDGGYVLGVHIADVAAYVQPGSKIDEIAADRGTSIYLPDRTIPMLPGVLSSDLCSLNPGEERNTVSVLIALDDGANVTGFDVSKSTITSRVKGSYDEVNRILSGTATRDTLTKYRSFEMTLREMDELACNLLQNRIAKGAKIFDNNEPRISVEGNQIEISYKPRGRAERIIEEFMVLANRVIAEYFEANGLPTIYRSQSASKAMAEYGAANPGHANLALERYVHFTSPIRRVADLKTHQILSLFLDGEDPEELSGRFGPELVEMGKLATKRSRRADGVQKACAKLCCRFYFKEHAGETFDGEVVNIGKNDRPVILIRKLHIRVYGPSHRGLTVGQKIAFCVGVDDERNEAIAYRIHPKNQQTGSGKRRKRHSSRGRKHSSARADQAA